MIPDLNLMLGPYTGPNPTFGFFPENAALVNPDNIKGMVTIEPGGSCTPGNPMTLPLSDAQIGRLATIPTLVLYGDHLSGGFARGYDDCRNNYAPRIQVVGGDITFISLPEQGIVGNGHMMMLDRNNLEIADIIMDRITNDVS